MKASKTSTPGKARWTTAQKAAARKARGSAAPSRGAASAPRENAKKRYAGSTAHLRPRRGESSGAGPATSDTRRPGTRPDRRDDAPRYRRDDAPRYQRDDSARYRRDGATSDERPRYDRPRDDRAGYGRPRADRPGFDRPRFDRARDERPRDDRPRDDRGGYGRPREDRPRYDGARDQRPRDDRPRQDRPSYGPPRVDRPGLDRPRFDRARDERPRDDRPREDRPGYDRARDERPRYDRSRTEGPDRDQRWQRAGDSRERGGYARRTSDTGRDAGRDSGRDAGRDAGRTPRTWSDDRPKRTWSDDRARTPRREDARRDDGYRSDARRDDSYRGEAPRRGDSYGEAPRRDVRPAQRPVYSQHGAHSSHRPDRQADRMRRQEPPRRDIPDHGPLTDPDVGADNAFLTLGLPEILVRRLARDGITEPFPIQAATIPDALAGRDVLGRGRTGSGKTLAFGLPTLARLAAGEPAAPKRPKALVLVPTRELAIQVSDALEPLAHVAGVRHKLVAGGLAYATQFAALERGVDLLIATPGRLLDLVERDAVALDAVTVAILDEADHMADMGFLPDVTALLDMIPAGGQRLLFSATLDKGIDELVARYLTDPVEHATDAATASVTTMTHHVLLVEPNHKKLVTAQVANRDGRTLVFVRTKLGADRVAREIREQGVLAAALHGGLNQGTRNRVLAAFRDGRMPVLVATDVAARGIHVDDVSVVLQVDPPMDPKDYLHRAGRTARAGEDGTVVTLALPHQRRSMERLCAAAGVDVVPVHAGPGDEALLAATGARRTTGIPVPEESYLRIVEPPPRRRPQRAPYGATRRPARDGDRRRMAGRDA